MDTNVSRPLLCSQNRLYGACCLFMVTHQHVRAALSVPEHTAAVLSWQVVGRLEQPKILPLVTHPPSQATASQLLLPSSVFEMLGQSRIARDTGIIPVTRAEDCSTYLRRSSMRTSRWTRARPGAMPGSSSLAISAILAHESVPERRRSPATDWSSLWGPPPWLR
jgi:hypothetical protein